MGNLIVTISIILGILLFGYILGDISLGETLSLIENASASDIAGYLFCSFAVMLIFVLTWNVVMKSQKMNIPFTNLFNYRVADYTMSFLTPGPKTGGEFTRAALVERHGYKYSDAFGNIVLDKSIELFTNCLFFGVGIAVVTSIVPLPLFWIILLYFLSGIYFLFFVVFYANIFYEKKWVHKIFKFLRLNRIKKTKKIEKDILEFEKKLKNFYVKDKKSFFAATLYSLSRWVFSTIEFKIILLMLGFNVSYPEIFLIFTFLGVGHLFPIPMGLGTIEAAQIAIMTILGLPVNVGVMVALINRLRDLLWSSWGLIVLFYYGFDFKILIKKVFRRA